MAPDEFLRKFFADFDFDFQVASDHPYNCTCDKCKDWWIAMGPDPDTNAYGPFTVEEILAYVRSKTSR